MSSYEAGFSAGERQACKDRTNAVRKVLPSAFSPYARGFADGYTPRSSTWWVSRPAQAWWQERESELS